MRKLICATTLLFVVSSTAAADQFLGAIRKIEDGKITVTKITKTKKSKAVVLKVAAKVRANRLNINLAKRTLEVSKPFRDGLKNKAFTKVKGKRGLVARITTNDDGEVTEVTLMPAGVRIRIGPKKKNKKDA